MTLGPTPPRERLESLDVLRGVALFGVLLENLQHFVVPTYSVWVAGPEANGLDRAAFWLVRFACDNKVYALFSFLFGYGIALQILRAAAGSAHFVTLHCWRMAVLFLIGLAHLLLWAGDILTTYALLGLLLLPLRAASARVLWSVAAGGLLAPVAGVALLAVGGAVDPEVREGLEAFTRGEIYPIRQACFAFGLFALGLAAGRAGALEDAARFTARARRAVLPALAAGVVANLAYVALLEGRSAGELGLAGFAVELCAVLGTPTLAFVILWGVLRGLVKSPWRTALLPLTSVGRTSLTSYLLQTAIGVGILARTGLGPLGPITPPIGLALTVAIFTLQVVASRWWLARFRFGPVEWIWRSATYGRRQPMRARGRNGGAITSG